MKTNRISFCTTCMNRLSHLKKTLKRNILDNLDYPNIEFVLLDYNSSDGLEIYIKSEFNDFINKGILVYYRTESHLHYNMSHSRNVAFKLATGDIVCNIDADNFMGIGFASYVNKVFLQEKNVFLSTHKPTNTKNDILGRICVRKDHFISIGGYDERMKYYGFDDYDFINRLQIYGLKQYTIDTSEFLQAITHSDADRMINGLNINALEYFFIRYISPYQSELFFLLKNAKAYSGTMVNNHVSDAVRLGPHCCHFSKYEYSIEEKEWISGKWEEYDNQIFFLNNDRKIVLKHYDNYSGCADSKHIYNKIENDRLKEEAMFFFHQLSNRIIMEENLVNNNYRANKKGYGRDFVRKNFNPFNEVVK